MFEVGDRVKVIDEGGWNKNAKDMVGTVRNVTDAMCSVEFDEPFRGHSCGGIIKDNQGYNYEFRCLEKIEVSTKRPRKFWMIAAQWTSERKDKHGNGAYANESGTPNSPPRSRFFNYFEAKKVAEDMCRKYGHRYYLLESVEYFEKQETPIENFAM